MKSPLLFLLKLDVDGGNYILLIWKTIICIHLMNYDQVLVSIFIYLFSYFIYHFDSIIAAEDNIWHTFYYDERYKNKYQSNSKFWGDLL